MVLPLAGKPASNRMRMVSFLTVQAVRARTSCPGWEVKMAPLFPEPFAWKEYRSTAFSNRRRRKSQKAVRLSALLQYSLEKPEALSVIWMVSLEGEAKGSPCTWSMDSCQEPN